jgi:hypothetical protein
LQCPAYHLCCCPDIIDAPPTLLELYDCSLSLHAIHRLFPKLVLEWISVRRKSKRRVVRGAVSSRRGDSMNAFEKWNTVIECHDVKSPGWKTLFYCPLLASPGCDEPQHLLPARHCRSGISSPTSAGM